MSPVRSSLIRQPRYFIPPGAAAPIERARRARQAVPGERPQEYVPVMRLVFTLWMVGIFAGLAYMLAVVAVGR